MSTTDHPDRVVAPSEAGPPTRRCWRCLQTFECEASDVTTGPAQWWLCEPCHGSLVGD